MNSASLADMIARINAQANSRKKRTASSVGDLSRFRPNFLVGGPGLAAYAEDDWQKVCIGTHELFTAGEILPLASCLTRQYITRIRQVARFADSASCVSCVCACNICNRSAYTNSVARKVFCYLYMTAQLYKLCNRGCQGANSDAIACYRHSIPVTVLLACCF